MVYFAQYLTNREKRVDWVLVGITGFFAFWGGYGGSFILKKLFDRKKDRAELEQIAASAAATATEAAEAALRMWKTLLDEVQAELAACKKRGIELERKIEILEKRLAEVSGKLDLMEREYGAIGKSLY